MSVLGILLSAGSVCPVPFQIIALQNGPIMRVASEASLPPENMYTLDQAGPHAALQSGNEAITAAFVFKTPISR